jgi:hypothetical protein
MTEREDKELDEFISKIGEEKPEKSGSRLIESSCQESPATKKQTDPREAYQWIVSGNTFSPTGETTSSLPVGAYKANIDGYGICHLQKMNIITDELLKLPDTSSTRVLNAIDVFWNAKQKFIEKGQLFKRGIMLWGPPGSGKTVTVMLLIDDLIKRGGIVLVSQNPQIASRALETIREIEPDRPLICVLEDIDELIDNFGESAILSLLDGENQINNVVHLATTNYPERLDARIANRPSRFDEIIKIGMPSIEARRFYLRSRITNDELNDESLEKWVIESSDLSIAHLKELVIAVFCLGRNYEETIIRLKKMKITPKSNDAATLGFNVKGD